MSVLRILEKQSWRFVQKGRKSLPVRPKHIRSNSPERSQIRQSTELRPDLPIREGGLREGWNIYQYIDFIIYHNFLYLPRLFMNLFTSIFVVRAGKSARFGTTARNGRMEVLVSLGHATV
jgi:hypothetical protein